MAFARSLAVAGILAALPLQPATAQTRAGSLSIKPTTIALKDGSSVAAEEGSFWVREDRNDPRSRFIRIAFIRLRSTSANPGLPLVYLGGGPGSAGSIRLNGPRQPVFLALRAYGDVIVFDQRGSGLSNQVPECRAKPDQMPRMLTESTVSKAFRQLFDGCLAFWRSGGVAVHGYTTAQSAEDIEDLRRLLGVPKVNLWAISYGTHLAMALMRRHPSSIERAVFVATEGLSQTVKLPHHVEAVYPRMERAAGLPPGELTATMKRVHARFDAKPHHWPAAGTDPAQQAFASDSFPLRLLASTLPKNPDGIPTLVRFYRDLDRGADADAARKVRGFFYGELLGVRGMPELMDLASGITEAKLAEVRRQGPSAIVGTATNFPMPQLRGALPGIDLGDRFRVELNTKIPVLAIMGELDVRSPIEEQREALKGFGTLRTLIVRNGGHDLYEAHPAIPGIVIDFFRGRWPAVTELSLPAPVVN